METALSMIVIAATVSSKCKIHLNIGNSLRAAVSLTTSYCPLCTAHDTVHVTIFMIGLTHGEATSHTALEDARTLLPDLVLLLNECSVL